MNTYSSRRGPIFVQGLSSIQIAVINSGAVALFFLLYQETHLDSLNIVAIFASNSPLRKTRSQVAYQYNIIARRHMLHQKASEVSHFCALVGCLRATTTMVHAPNAARVQCVQFAPALIKTVVLV